MACAGLRNEGACRESRPFKFHPRTFGRQLAIHFLESKQGSAAICASGVV